jgi:hypothetical protein
MRLSRWLFGCLGVVVGILVVLALQRESAQHGEVLLGGENAPYRAGWTGEWEAVARLDGAGGNVQDMAVSGYGVFVLFPREWYRVLGDTVLGPFGSPVTGSPGWMRRGQSIAVSDSGVLILDAGSRDISSWGLDGTYRGRTQVHAPGAARIQWLQQLLTAASGEPVYVVANLLERDGRARWAVLQLDGSGRVTRTVFESPIRDVPGGMFEIPTVHVRPDGSLLIATALEYRLRGVSAEGAVLFDGRREDFPRISIPDTVRRAHVRSLSGSPVTAGRAYRLPAYFPPVRSVYWRMDGRTMTLISQGADRFHIELLDANLVPVARLWDQPGDGAHFLTSDAVYRVREDPDGVLIARKALKLPDVGNLH